MDDDGQAGGARRRLARGTAPKVAASAVAPGGAAGVTAGSVTAVADDAAGSIAEAVERLMSDREAEEAIAEWAREG